MGGQICVARRVVRELSINSFKVFGLYLQGGRICSIIMFNILCEKIVIS